MRLSYSLRDKFNLYSSDRSLCPLCLCGSFHSLPQNCILEYILPAKLGRAEILGSKSSCQAFICIIFRLQC
ncbi:MAG: hypothetical protein GPJ19_19590 [Microcystis aeruginosa LG13-13]|nr:hypothetical protein [Microcystis aeruginosa LG13-13]